MSAQEDSHGPAIRSLLEQLSTTASSLNTASDRLNKQVDHLESALQKFNLGISCWEDFAVSDSSEAPMWRKEQIGYARFKDKWRIGLRRMSGHEFYAESDEQSEWPFVEAPRDMRVRATKFFGLLITKLNERAAATLQELSTRTAEVQQLSCAIDSVFDSRTTQVSGAQSFHEFALIERLRDAVTVALHSKGYETASELLRSGQWTVDDSSITVSVPVKKAMLSITMNPEAERIARAAIQQAGSSAKLIVLPQGAK